VKSRNQRRGKRLFLFFVDSIKVSPSLPVTPMTTFRNSKTPPSSPSQPTTGPLSSLRCSVAAPARIGLSFPPHHRGSNPAMVCRVSPGWWCAQTAQDRVVCRLTCCLEPAGTELGSKRRGLPVVHLYCKLRLRLLWQHLLPELKLVGRRLRGKAQKRR
jgi:hypothetical protein